MSFVLSAASSARELTATVDVGWKMFENVRLYLDVEGGKSIVKIELPGTDADPILALNSSELKALTAFAASESAISKMLCRFRDGGSLYADTGRLHIDMSLNEHAPELAPTKMKFKRFWVSVTYRYRPLDFYEAMEFVENVELGQLEPLTKTAPVHYAVDFSGRITPVTVFHHRHKNVIDPDTGRKENEQWVAVSPTYQVKDVREGKSSLLAVLELPRASLLMLSEADFQKQGWRISDHGITGEEHLGFADHYLAEVYFEVPPADFEILSDTVKRQIHDKSLSVEDYDGLQSRIGQMHELSEALSDTTRRAVEAIRKPVKDRRPSFARLSRNIGSVQTHRFKALKRPSIVARDKAKHILLQQGAWDHDTLLAFLAMLYSPIANRGLRETMSEVLLRPARGPDMDLEREMIFLLRSGDRKLIEFAESILSKIGVVSLLGQMDLSELLASPPKRNGRADNFAVFLFDKSGVRHPEVVCGLLNTLANTATRADVNLVARIFKPENFSHLDANREWSPVYTLMRAYHDSRRTQVRYPVAVLAQVLLLNPYEVELILLKGIGDPFKEVREASLRALNTQAAFTQLPATTFLALAKLLDTRERTMAQTFLLKWYQSTGSLDAAEQLLIQYTASPDRELATIAAQILRNEPVEPPKPGEVDGNVQALIEACEARHPPK